MVTLATVRLWGQSVGAVNWNRDRGVATFAYTPAFVQTGLDVAPLKMPLTGGAATVYSFPALNPDTYHGLPGLLADSLPDRFGNQLINTWLATQGRAPADFSPVERLCYIANRGMGALEFEPALPGGAAAGSQPVEIAALVELAQEVLDQREGLRVNLRDEATEGLAGLLAVGTSGGGAKRARISSSVPRKSSSICSLVVSSKTRIGSSEEHTFTASATSEGLPCAIKLVPAKAI